MFDLINGHVMNLANSIIGVSILAMPYCFKQCGIVLSILMLVISSAISRLACHFLLKSAIVARRKTFEFLAYHIFGSLGKLAIEIGMIGFLLGTCIAFFVVMGDLAPEIISEITGTTSSNALRTSLLMALALFCVLPLGLLRNVDSLNGVSQATIAFYCCLVLKVIFEAAPRLFDTQWYGNVNLWKPEGIMQCLPIFSMALFCQTQLFEIYQAVQNATLEKMNHLVKIAVNICTCVYILVGTFGYIAFANKQFTGNILLSFLPSFMTDLMKIGFVLSLAFSFPLVIFPCRASLYSLLYREGYSLHEGVSSYIPEAKFKALTLIIVFISLIIGIMIPSIELVLGLVGSTIGVMICVLFPVTCFICISLKNTNERILAQAMLMIGIFVMVLGTYKNLHSLDNPEAKVIAVANPKIVEHKLDDIIIKLPSTVKIEIKTTEKVKEVKEIRHEPPQPIEPVNDKIEVAKQDEELPKKVEVPIPEIVVTNPPVAVVPPVVNKNESKLDVEAIKKDEKEEKINANDDHKVLIDTIQQQHEVQKEIVEQQKRLIEVIENQQKQSDKKDVDIVKEEKLKAVKEIESIALKAIEKISGGKNEQLFEEVKNNIKNKEKGIVVKTEEEKKEENFEKTEKKIENKIEKIENKEENDGNQEDIKVLNKVVEENIVKTNKNEVKSELNSSLFLKIGNEDVRINDEQNPERLLPLPIAISNNQQKNLSKEHKDVEEQEAQAMRREIL